jgi:hypothetical protein
VKSKIKNEEQQESRKAQHVTIHREEKDGLGVCTFEKKSF